MYEYMIYGLPDLELEHQRPKDWEIEAKNVFIEQG